MTRIDFNDVNQLKIALDKRHRHNGVNPAKSLPNGRIVHDGKGNFSVQGNGSPTGTMHHNAHPDLIGHLQSLFDEKIDKDLETKLAGPDVFVMIKFYAEHVINENSYPGQIMRYTLNYQRNNIADLINGLEVEESIVKLGELRKSAENQMVTVLRLDSASAIDNARNRAMGAMGKAAKLAQYMGNDELYYEMVLQIRQFIDATQEKMELLSPIPARREALV